MERDVHAGRGRGDRGVGRGERGEGRRSRGEVEERHETDEKRASCWHMSDACRSEGGDGVGASGAPCSLRHVLLCTQCGWGRLGIGQGAGGGKGRCWHAEWGRHFLLFFSLLFICPICARSHFPSLALFPRGGKGVRACGRSWR